MLKIAGFKGSIRNFRRYLKLLGKESEVDGTVREHKREVTGAFPAGRD